ncbi:MAG: 2-hydroxychromene-2-carboxylate isomerase [Candidatus Binatia bacterium]
MPRVVHYFDYKSPYAYLAQEPTRRLARDLGVEIEWLPYTLDIPAYLGSAELDADGKDVIGTRNDHQWRRVRYAYMDCRREATRRGLVLRGPRKIFDSSVAHVAFLFARGRPDVDRFHDAVFEKFWRRELDLESPEAIAAELAAGGIDPAGFPGYLAGEGRALHDRLREEACAKGVFGVPSYLVGDELFWGTERLDRVRERLTERFSREPG